MLNAAAAKGRGEWWPLKLSRTMHREYQSLLVSNTCMVLLEPEALHHTFMSYLSNVWAIHICQRL
jgi:hypothetical protein